MGHGSKLDEEPLNLLSRLIRWIGNDNNLRVWNQIPPYVYSHLDSAPSPTHLLHYTLIPRLPIPIGCPYRQLLDEVGDFPQPEEQEGKVEGVSGGVCAGGGSLVATVLGHG